MIGSGLPVRYIRFLFVRPFRKKVILLFTYLPEKMKEFTDTGLF